MGTIAENIESIQKEKAEAAERAGRNPEDILLCAVTKTHTAEEINEAIRAGVTDIGENKVQEILDKYDKVLPVRWHMIGHLQTNKVKYIIDSVSVIQSVDSAKLAAEVDRQAQRLGKIQDILIEVNIGDEASKGGVGRSFLRELLYEAAEMKNIKVCGLMAIPPAENAEKFLCDMQQLYIDISSENIDNINMDILSMGMSNDYIKAIQYGSNLIRIGRGLFGPRIYK